jgi:hypothetical protein
MDDFVIHACEQSLRFSTVSSWESLSDKLKMQFSFNYGVMALGLDLTKEEGYDALASVCLGQSTMRDLHTHIRALMASRNIAVNEERVARPF